MKRWLEINSYYCKIIQAHSGDRNRTTSEELKALHGSVKVRVHDSTTGKIEKNGIFAGAPRLKVILVKKNAKFVSCFPNKKEKVGHFVRFLSRQHFKSIFSYL